ncbi:Set1 complex component ash2 [Erysiphe necator]|uniref:Putative ash2-trithorax family protein n=1 Tax=Uncinula necator TaxID=52586 RepID=A0A0B1NV41_UNCNE|nr:Set1 complex component ash2 [Erysiphe necator]KHJ30222.1 putative ash2-trithorax family protein [Erysiphe necator]
MEIDGTPSLPKREKTPLVLISNSSIPQKRTQEDDHITFISSPLNPDFKETKPLEELPYVQRAARVKKESLKKRESKGNTNGETNIRDTNLERSSVKNKKKKKPVVEIGPLRYKLATVPGYNDFKPPQNPGFNPVERKSYSNGIEIVFNETIDHVFNKKSFNYTSAVPDPIFRHSLLFRQSEVPPYTARFSFEDRASNILIDQEAKHITTDKGWRSAKANVCMREGRWYWECRVNCGTPRLESTSTTGISGPHVRMGIGRREATLDGPVGFDCYSYGLRDLGGQKIHMSRPKAFFPNGENICEGDVIGFEVNLPSASLHHKIVNGTYKPKIDFKDLGNTGIEKADIIRDRAPIKIKDYWVFEQAAYAPGKELQDWCSPAPTAFKHEVKPCFTHPSVPLRTLPHSYIKVYKNGILMGTAFENLFAFLPPASKPATVKDMFFREGLDDGTLGYYPIVSVFQGGCAEVNFGPKYWFPPPEIKQFDNGDIISNNQPLDDFNEQRIRPLNERYDEQIIEDILADLVDEVYFWVLDEAPTDTDDMNHILYNGIHLSENSSNDRTGPTTNEETKYAL